ncbi:MAG: D-alanine--D-alanine ligase [Rhodospirillales bacterium]|nr:D-alanine--D-alanine ligase [Rhodospirillales bacterium]
MRVGLTYDLRDDYLAQGMTEEETAEFDSVATIEAIETALQSRGYVVDRIGNLHDLMVRLIAGQTWDFVFNIAEGVHGIGRESQVPAVLDACAIPYTFSDPLTMSVTLDKAVAKRIVRDHDIPTAPFALVRQPSDIAKVEISFPAFAKPVGEGTGKGIGTASRIVDRSELTAVSRHLLTTYAQSVIVESYLPGREFTVGVLGTGEDATIMGVIEVVPRDLMSVWTYGFENKEHYEDRVDYRLVDDDEARLAAATALRAWNALNCRDGGRVDLRSDANGVPNFIEVNPLAGLHPVRSDLVILARRIGMSYEDLIGRIVDSCLKRITVFSPPRKACGRKVAA